LTSQTQPRVLQVGWKVHALAEHIASVRIRAVLPMLALESAGVHSRLFASAMDSELDGLDVLVIVKSFTPGDLRLAQLASARGIRVVYDLCDNIFVGDYGRGKPGLSPAEMFQSIVEYANCIVTTTEPLAEAIRAHVPSVPVVVIPDGIETSRIGKRIGQALVDAHARHQARRARMLRQRVRNVMHRVRIEGLGVVPALVGHFARRAAGTLVRRMRHSLHSRSAAPVADEVPGPQASGRRSIVWFGNHGAEHARFGMLDILEFRDALEAIAAEQDVELVVISNSRAKYESAIRPLAIASRYVEWSATRVDRWLAQAAAVILPNTLDAFSICKSANRTVLALAHGVPVVATLTPALQPLAEFIHTGDPLRGLRRIFSDPEAARAQAAQGHRQAQVLFGEQAIQAHWLRLLEQTPASTSAAAANPPYLAVVLHLAQDLDLALPILQAARSAGIRSEAWCSGTLFRKSPRVRANLRQEGIPFKVLPDDEFLSTFVFPAGVRALLTVAESNLGPHRVPRLLTDAALRQGLFVATLQHGFENIGLSYDDEVHACDKVNIAARRIYTWGQAHTLHPRATASVRERCVPVGCPKPATVPPAALDGVIPKDRPVVGIFENLHWHRYSEEYKGAFLDNVRALTREFPGVFFLLKPHHAGLWLTQRHEGEKPAGDNLLIADPEAQPWENHTAGSLLGHMDAVITSPSTVALDAARMGLPVAVVAGDLQLENYRPLPLLATQGDWSGFVSKVLDAQARAELQQRSAGFVERVLVPGDAARRIVEDLRAAAGA
jgi:glycosyltransferase involved in cell wall biosynthesis